MLSPTKIMGTIARFIMDCLRGIWLSLKLGVAGELVESEYDEDSGKSSMDDSNCAGQMNYADAARIGISRESRKIEKRDPRRVAIEACLVEVVLQFERDLGWRARFVLDGRYYGFIFIYHLSICRQRRLSEKYLGTVVFNNSDDGEDGWTSPVGSSIDERFKFSKMNEIPRALEQFFASSYIGQILVEVFGKPRVKKGAGK